ncbi:trypsin-1-like [Lutzomyia longipalpis]|uniref:trypsin-1-like n=1 Tax=Lutzomyia longipalpis TaxID=7200 RepID=UPI002483318E|nr:trypsin-1-like [Lutzomyia longipalpis]
MKILVVLSTLLAASLAVPTLPLSSVGNGRIVGGVNALPGEFPYICSIQWVLLTASTHICGASVVNNNWVLTAAHCITEAPNIGRLEILCGKLNLAIVEPNQARVGVASHVLHESWVPGAVGPFDIALIRLAAPLVYNDWIQPVVFPAAGSHPSGVSQMIGWGSTSGGTIPTNPDILQKVNVPVVEYSACRAALEAIGGGADNVFDDTKICTGPLTGGVSACSGDSGSPVLQGSTQIGIVSWGFMPCGSAGAPSVHTRVAHFITWINNIVN